MCVCFCVPSSLFKPASNQNRKTHIYKNTHRATQKVHLPVHLNWERGQRRQARERHTHTRTLPLYTEFTHSPPRLSSHCGHTKTAHLQMQHFSGSIDPLSFKSCSGGPIQKVELRPHTHTCADAQNKQTCVLLGSQKHAELVFCHARMTDVPKALDP